MAKTFVSGAVNGGLGCKSFQQHLLSLFVIAWAEGPFVPALVRTEPRRSLVWAILCLLVRKPPEQRTLFDHHPASVYNKQQPKRESGQAKQ